MIRDIISKFAHGIRFEVAFLCVACERAANRSNADRKLHLIPLSRCRNPVVFCENQAVQIETSNYTKYFPGFSGRIF